MQTISFFFFTIHFYQHRLVGFPKKPKKILGPKIKVAKNVYIYIYIFAKLSYCQRNPLMKNIKTKKKYLYDLGNFNSPLLDKPLPWAGPRVKYCLRCSFWLLAVYSRAENKEASLPAGTIPLAYVRRYSVQKWTVGRVGGVTSVVQVIKCAQKRATDRLSATLQSILQHAIWLACAKREKTTLIPWEKGVCNR